MRESEREAEVEVEDDAGAERDVKETTGASPRATMEDCKDVPHILSGTITADDDNLASIDGSHGQTRSCVASHSVVG